MKTNTITTIKLEAEEGFLLVHSKNHLINGKVFYCPATDISLYEEYPEAEAMKLVEAARAIEAAKHKKEDGNLEA